MSLKNLFHKESREKAAAAACGTACGAGDKQPQEKPAACGAGDKQPQEQPAACGTACGAGDK